MTTLEFLQHFLDKKGKISSYNCRQSVLESNKKLYEKYKELTQELPDNLTNGQKIRCVMNGIFKAPNCLYCGKPVTNLDVSKGAERLSFYQYCSVKCGAQNNKGYKHTEEIKNKRKQTMKEKYGSEFNFQREKVKDKIKNNKLTEEQYEKLRDKEWLYNEHVVKEKTASQIANEIKCFYGTVIDYLRTHDIELILHKRSSYELKIQEWLDEYNIQYVCNDRKILDKGELDFYLPDYKLAIEFNGCYWHNNDIMHNIKMSKLSKMGIDLLVIPEHMFEPEHKWKSWILRRCGKLDKFDARKCVLKRYSNTNEKITSFFNDNHLQSFAGGNLYLTLEYNDEIIASMIVGKSRFNKEYNNELIRYCQKSDISCRGAFSRLLKYTPKPLITYCDKQYSNGNLYRKFCKEILKDSYSSFVWVNGRTFEAVSRYKAQHQNMQKFLKNYDPNLTQDKNMFNNGYFKIWDSGQYVFIL